MVAASLALVPASACARVRRGPDERGQDPDIGTASLLLPAISDHNAERILATDGNPTLRLSTLLEIRWAFPNRHVLATKENTGFNLAIRNNSGRENRQAHYCNVTRVHTWICAGRRQAVRPSILRVPALKRPRPPSYAQRPSSISATDTQNLSKRRVSVMRTNSFPQPTTLQVDKAMHNPRLLHHRHRIAGGARSRKRSESTVY